MNRRTCHPQRRRRSGLILALLVAVGVSFYLATPVRAQSGDNTLPTADQVNQIAKKLYCPVCPNTPLDVCETKACQDWRAQIKDQLAAGWSEDQIINYFVTQYGERVLAEPRRQGFSSLVWVLPVMAVIIGLVVIWQVLRSWAVARQARIGPSPPPQVSPETLARIEKELNDIS